jgi:ABC-type multidrug transport system fused ATPase/permease subunit
LRDSSVPHLPFRELPVAHIGTPDRGGPIRYLWWIARTQKLTLFFNAFFGITWMVAQALTWAAVGAAIDYGISKHNGHALFKWVLIVVGLGIFQALSGAIRHQLAVTNWMNAAYRTVESIARHVATTGTAVTDIIPSGDVVNTVGADAMRIGGAYDVVARFAGAIVSWIVVSVILLSSSLKLGLIVLIGVPVLASLTTPLMRPLHSSQAAQRESGGKLAALAADTVVGLRILRGVGGEDVFFQNYKNQSTKLRAAGVRVALPQATLESGQVLLPAILTTIVTYFGAMDVLTGQLRPGQLVAFFGYASFLTTPLRTAIEYVISTTRAYVGAGKVLNILTIAPTITSPEVPKPWPSSLTSIADERSGLTLTPTGLVGLVTETPNQASELCDRIGRFTPDTEGVTVNGQPLSQFSLDDTRRNIVVSEIEPRLFAGELRYELLPHSEMNDQQIMDALAATSSLDILEVLDNGLGSWVEERGRSFSGGQRQRLTLARAILLDAPVLILIEPTSAVDTHTEGRIAERLRGAREGRSTLVASSSPLMLEKLDSVYLVIDDKVEAHGTHAELLKNSSAYRRIVMREDN